MRSSHVWLEPESVRPSVTAGSLRWFVWRSLLRTMREPAQWLSMLVFSNMFLVAFSLLFGLAIAGDVSGYIDYVVPGMMVQYVLTMSSQQAVFLHRDLSAGVYDRFWAYPIRRLTPLLGVSIADCARYCITAASILTGGLILKAIYDNEGFGESSDIRTAIAGRIFGVVFLSLCTATVAWIWFYLAVRIKSPFTFQTLSTLFMFVLTYGSTAFVPASSVPSAVAGFMQLNPVSHLVELERSLFDGIFEWSIIAVTSVSLALVGSIFCYLSVRRVTYSSN